jgi:rhodanese-related sulfurtransferase
MPLSIKNDRTERLARQVASETGESLTEAIHKALEERWQQLKAKRRGRVLTGQLEDLVLLGELHDRATYRYFWELLQKARITPDELKARLERGERVTILDVRADDEVAGAPHALPGALWIRPDDLPRRLRDLPRDAMVVLYGRRLKRPRSGPAIPYANASVRVRPLAGGLPAWRRRGYPVQAADVGGR